MGVKRLNTLKKWLRTLRVEYAMRYGNGYRTQLSNGLPVTLYLANNPRFILNVSVDVPLPPENGQIDATRTHKLPLDVKGPCFSPAYLIAETTLGDGFIIDLIYPSFVSKWTWILTEPQIFSGLFGKVLYVTYQGTAYRPCHPKGRILILAVAQKITPAASALINAQDGREAP